MKRVVWLVMLLVVLTGSMALASEKCGVCGVEHSQHHWIALNAAKEQTATEVEFMEEGKRMSVDALTVDGVSYLPIRQVITKLGGRVYWYGKDESRQICLVFGKTKVFLDLINGEFMQDGRYLPLDESNFYWKDGHAYLQTSEMMKMLQVKWN